VITLQPGDSLQQAIDQARKGDVICLQEGTWEENIKIGKSLVLRGQGPGATIIKAVEEGLPGIWIVGRKIQVGLEGLTITGAYGGCADRRRSVCAYGTFVQGFAQVTFKGSQISDNWSDLHAQNSAQVILTASKISGSLEVSHSAQLTSEGSEISGLELRGSSRVTLINSRVSGKGDHGVSGSASATIISSQISGSFVVGGSARVILEGSLISGSDKAGLLVSDSSTVEVRGSRFFDNLGCAIELLSFEARVRGTPNEMRGNGADLCGFAPASLRQPLVAQTDREEVAVPSDYATVQEAVDAVAPGGTITLAAGTSVGGLTIWKPVTIRGQGREKTILQAGEGKGPIISIIHGVKDIRLEGLAVIGSANYGLFIYGQADLRDLRISGNHWGGIGVRGFAGVAIIDSEISGSFHGLETLDSPRVTVKSSQISDNILGLSIEHFAIVTIQDSRVSDNSAWGFLIRGSSRVTLTGSHVSDNGWVGLEVSGHARVTIQDSTTEGNGSRARAEECSDARWFCSSILLGYGAPLVRVVRSRIQNNINWGIVAELKKCDYFENYSRGRVTFEEMELDWISGNNTTGNLDGRGNPGHHPWNRPEVPDGQVCF
jgi:nitrous oxidase accessory protein NosD